MTDQDDLRRLQHPQFSRAFADLSITADERGGAGHRQRLLAGLHGTVLELGAGNGRNFRHYPPQVTRVLAVEPDATMRDLAARAAAEASVPIDVIPGRAEALPAAAAGVDAVVASLVLCTVDDVRRTLSEVRRVLRPGGELRYYEHVRSSGPRGAVQDIVRPLWSLACGGCRPNRRTVQEIRAAGLVVDREDRFRWRMVRFSPVLDFALGTARLP